MKTRTEWLLWNNGVLIGTYKTRKDRRSARQYYVAGMSKEAARLVRNASHEIDDETGAVISEKRGE